MSDRLVFEQRRRQMESDDTLKPWTIRAAAEFLDAYADRLSNDGCNDYEVPDWMPRDELKALIAKWDKNNPDTDGLETYNWAVVNAIAVALRDHAPSPLAAEVARLQAENARLREACAAALAASESMWGTIGTGRSNSKTAKLQSQLRAALASKDAAP